MKTIDHPRWGRCAQVESTTASALVSLGFGPRIVSLTLLSSTTNLLWEEDAAAPAMAGNTRLRAGHRLWTAPETADTWVDDEVKCVVDDEGWIAGPHDGRGLGRALRVRADGDALVVQHRVHNATSSTQTVAAWGITMFPAGAHVEVHLPPHQPWPEAVQASSSLALWPYTRLNDPRLVWGERCVTVRHAPAGPSLKVGGWLPAPRLTIGVAEGDHVVVVEKTWEATAEAPHADFGCNWEVYADAGVIEAESLTPLRHLASGDTLHHEERWRLKRMPRDG
jgi:hypothetical protein